jgi:iron uptake system EfeUOB component EfeO/EfeM
MNLFNKSATAIMTLALIGGIALTGCGTTTGASADNSAAGSTTNNTSSSNSTGSSAGDAAADSTNATANVKNGVAKLLALATEFKTDISSGDEAKIKENGPKLEDTWSSFEDSVKPKYPDLYDKVEQYLDPAVAGSKANQPDKDALLKLDDGLIQALTELSQKVQ